MKSNPERGIKETYACGIRNPTFWNPEIFSLESGIQILAIRIPGKQNY